MTAATVMTADRQAPEAAAVEQEAMVATAPAKQAGLVALVLTTA